MKKALLAGLMVVVGSLLLIGIGTASPLGLGFLATALLACAMLLLPKRAD
jgi:hypothetical protein